MPPPHPLTLCAPATGSARDAGLGRGVYREAARADDPGDAREGVDQRQRRRRRRSGSRCCRLCRFHRHHVQRLERALIALCCRRDLFIFRFCFGGTRSRKMSACAWQRWKGHARPRAVRSEGRQGAKGGGDDNPGPKQRGEGGKKKKEGKKSHAPPKKRELAAPFLCASFAFQRQEAPEIALSYAPVGGH